MYQIVKEIIKKLTRDELCHLLGAVADWYDVPVPGTVEKFQEWLEAQQLDAVNKLKVA